MAAAKLVIEQHEHGRCSVTGEVEEATDQRRRTKHLRMPEEDINWILQRKEPSFDEADKLAARMELRRPIAAHDELMRNGWYDDLLALQRDIVEKKKASWAWFCERRARVRAEFEANGFVEVDDDYFEQKEKNRAYVWENCGKEFAQILLANEDGEFGERNPVSDDKDEQESDFSDIYDGYELF
uniref:Uncharacterized protein n=1 Tax=Leersia perrieri TaxID=77586 RepID=A0A0D9WW95_9ORYZ